VCDHLPSQIDWIGTGIVAIGGDHCTARIRGMQPAEKISDFKSQMGKTKAGVATARLLRALKFQM